MGADIFTPQFRLKLGTRTEVEISTPFRTQFRRQSKCQRDIYTLRENLKLGVYSSTTV
jgi:hypothetical protein